MARGGLLERVTGALRSLVASSSQRTSPSPTVPPSPGAARPTPSRGGRERPQRAAYRGDFTGVASIEYEPRRDGDADPGEVVWAWVPFEDDHERGKDRPVLVLARDGSDLLGLMLSSQDHDRDAAKEAARGRRWLDLGPGDWDPQGRPSEVRLDRVVRLTATDVRREGAILDPRRYEVVAAQVRELHGWR